MKASQFCAWFLLHASCPRGRLTKHMGERSVIATRQQWPTGQNEKEVYTKSLLCKNRCHHNYPHFPCAGAEVSEHVSCWRSPFSNRQYACIDSCHQKRIANNTLAHNTHIVHCPHGETMQQVPACHEVKMTLVFFPGREFGMPKVAGTGRLLLSHV